MMLRFSFASLVLVEVLVVAVFGATNLIQKCKLSDPKLNKCLTKNAIIVWPSMVQGDKSKRLLILDPLKVPFLHFPVHKNLVGNVTDAIIYGLQDMKINEININSVQNTLDVKFKIPRLTLFGNYDVTGQILGMFPLNGQGVVNFTSYDFDSHLHIDYELTEKNYKHYITVTNNSMVYNTTKLYFHLTNLFGGDKMLGDLTNVIMNDNWEAVQREVGGKVGEVFGETFTEISKGFFKKVPIEDIFSK